MKGRKEGKGEERKKRKGERKRGGRGRKGKGKKRKLVYFGMVLISHAYFKAFLSFVF